MTTIILLLFLILLCAAAATALLMSRVSIEIDTSRLKANDRITIDFRALNGLFKYRVYVPKIDFRNWSDGFFVKKKTSPDAVANNENANEVKLTRDFIVDYYERTRLFLKNVLDFTGWMKDTAGHLECTQFRWQTRIGLGDAPETAITTGIVWGLKSSLLGLTLPHIDLKTKPFVQVAPQYNSQHFSTDLLCKLQIRVFYLVQAAFRLLPRIWKAKGSWKSWQHILAKPRLKSTN